MSIYYFCLEMEMVQIWEYLQILNVSYTCSLMVTLYIFLVHLHLGGNLSYEVECGIFHLCLHVSINNTVNFVAFQISYFLT